jgi:peptidyl-prolyl cis-trans isomerase D
MVKERKSKPVATLTKKQLSRSQREKRQRFWVWIAVGAVALAVVAILAVGLITQSTRAMAVVNGERIRISEYQERARFWYYYYNNYLMAGYFDNLDAETQASFYQQIASQMIDERLVQQEARKKGLTATDGEVQVELEESWFQHYRVAPTPTPSPTPDPSATPTVEGTPLPTATPDTDEAFQTNYQKFAEKVLQPAGLTDADFREMVRVSVLEQKLKMALVPEVPAEEDQVHFRYKSAQDAETARTTITGYQAGVVEQVHAQHILVKTEDEANAVLKRLQAGEDFAALAAELSTDTSNKDTGGDLGWFGRGDMVTEFDTVAFDAPIGLYPSPVKTDYGYHVINILGHENRPVDLGEELTDAGWFGKSELADQFGAVFAEMLFAANVGLLPDPAPTSSGVMVVELLEHQVRTLTEQEQESRRTSLFQDQITQIREEGNVQDLWESSMIPQKM